MSRSNDYIPFGVRRLIAFRASYICEYCLLPEADSYIGYEVDHIISLKHGGSGIESNLAYSCPDCNCNKGSDLASIDWSTNQIVRFFNPRLDVWSEHFRLSSGFIESTTTIGKVTVSIFKFNNDERADERALYQSDN